MPFLLWIVMSFLVSSLVWSLGVMFCKTPEFSDSTECFECGIDPIGFCRVPFALHFFIVAIVFVLFDGELLASLPMVYPSIYIYYSTFWVIFMGLLLLGLVMEVFLGSIEWNE